MFPEERLDKIKEILVSKKKIDVPALSKMLSVSEVTVRRDLEKLELDNFLTRTHGGALLNEEQNITAHEFIYLNDFSYSEERERIGNIASCMVEDNDSIIIGPGTTCAYIAQAIKDKNNLKVVTSDIASALELSKSPTIKTVLLGGDLDNSTLQLSGRFAESMIEQYYVKTAFVEVDGVSLERGYTVESMEKAAMIRAIMKVAETTVCVCDYSRFDKVSFTPLGPITLFSQVISNQEVPEMFKSFYFKNNTRLFTTFDVYGGTSE
jgi:DeoR/GlpR family transcriptional regulator of sugar metabolism